MAILWKILSFVLIAGGGYLLLRKLSDPQGQAAPAPARRAEDLVECPDCGSYHPKIQICECRRTPTL